jgi:hypothetical protein
MPQIHLHAEPGDYAPLVLLPGDPNRATRIASMFDGGLEKARKVNDNRGLLGYTGTYQGKPVSVYPGVRNVHTPLYEDDYVEKTIGAAGIAKLGCEIVNVGGSEAMTTQDYCIIAGEMLGKEPIFVENSTSWPIWGDTTKMERLLGPSKVSIREGIRRIIENTDQRLANPHHVLGAGKK